MPIDIIYQDNDLLIANKPSGLLCVPGLSDPDNLHDRALKYNANARVVHRLDMATSGMVIFALNHQTQKQLGQMFERKEIKKSYIAEVAGRISENTGEVVSPLICDWEKRPKQKIDWLGGKRSHTQYQVINKGICSLGRTHTRVKLSPITGRTHQLRLHMEQIGHPILGDRLYHYPGINDAAERLLLHAYTLEFKHPTSGKDMKLACAPDF